MIRLFACLFAICLFVHEPALLCFVVWWSISSSNIWMVVDVFVWVFDCMVGSLVSFRSLWVFVTLEFLRCVALFSLGCV
jgi:hypothetical protein